MRADSGGETPVDDAVRMPPRPVQLHLSEAAVEQRPQDRVGETSVVPVDLVRTQRHGVQAQVFVVERLERRRRRARPIRPNACLPAVTDDSADAKPPGLVLSCPSAPTSTGSRLAATTSPFISSGLSDSSSEPVRCTRSYSPSKRSAGRDATLRHTREVRRGVDKMVIAVDVDGTLFDGVGVAEEAVDGSAASARRWPHAGDRHRTAVGRTRPRRARGARTHRSRRSARRAACWSTSPARKSRCSPNRPNPN